MHYWRRYGIYALWFAALPAWAADEPPRLDPVEVQSPRLYGVDGFDLPASLSVIRLDSASGRTPGNAAEVFAGLPGLLARDRQNQAQDTQLSIRGFGARATFGVRGLRLYADGIPATMPDGQGQLAHFSLLAAERIEVMRGPFSALYGNSSGGVVQIFSADGGAPTRLRAQASAGSYASQSFGASLRGAAGDAGYHVAASLTDSDGCREHSAARRESVNLKLRVPLGEDGRLDLIANRFDSPDAQDPLGLPRAEALADPRQATAVAHQYDTRKSVAQNQVGAVYEQPLMAGHRLRVMAYAGNRAVEQFLAIPAGVQANPLHAGGVVDLDGDYGGTDLRWSWHGELAARPLEFSAGLSADTQRQQRRGYENFVGTTLGVRGRLRRDEINQARNVDEYTQAWWQFADRWSLLAGLRHSRVRLESDDAYVGGGNPDDSGRIEYRQTTPVAGLVFAAADRLRLYASAGRGFETPTFNELSYRADGASGLALDLRPVRSRNTELGLKWQSAGGAQFEAALFRSDSEDELAVARNAGGRSSFRNAGRTRRGGLEISTSVPLTESWLAELAYTRLDAAFRDSLRICAAAGCTTPDTLVRAGTRLPGVARDQIAGRLQWQARRYSATAQLVGVGRVSVNDLGSQHAPGYGLLNLEASRDWPLGQGRLRGFARLDNVFDRRYIGSVIVNEGNARYYEPGPGRTWQAGLRWDWGD